MTKWESFPLRPQGNAWPGLNTRGGKLDPGQGQLEDGSFNAIINEQDILQKRKGFVRGLDERFDGVVCGLFRYTDDCGREYVVVADEEGIKVRAPFDIPEFLGSDSLPFDDFNTLDTTRWNNTSAYEVSIGALQLNGTDTLGTSDFVPAAQLMQWFKESVLTSYFIETQYRLTAGTQHNAASVVIKRTAPGTTYLEAAVSVQGTSYAVTLYLVQSGVRTVLATEALGGSTVADGFLRISYSVGTTFVATARVIPSGGSQVTISGSLNELQDSGLGQLSAVGLQRQATEQATPQLESVFGGRS